MRWGEEWVSELGGPERKSDMPKIIDLGCSSATEQREVARRWRAERCWELRVKIGGLCRSPAKGGRAVGREGGLWLLQDASSVRQGVICLHLPHIPVKRFVEDYGHRFFALPPSEVESISAIFESGLFLCLALTSRM